MCHERPHCSRWGSPFHRPGWPETVCKSDAASKGMRAVRARGGMTGVGRTNREMSCWDAAERGESKNKSLKTPLCARYAINRPIWGSFQVYSARFRERHSSVRIELPHRHARRFRRTTPHHAGAVAVDGFHNCQADPSMLPELCSSFRGVIPEIVACCGPEMARTRLATNPVGDANKERLYLVMRESAKTPLFSCGATNEDFHRL